jgi:hypothetical protein
MTMTARAARSNAHGSIDSSGITIVVGIGRRGMPRAGRCGRITS